MYTSLRVTADDPTEPDSGCNQTELPKLAEIYAIQVRQLSDAVATLGRRIAAGEEIGENIKEVERLQALADQACANLLGALQSPESQTTSA
jgi:hypothetical protein